MGNHLVGSMWLSPYVYYDYYVVKDEVSWLPGLFVQHQV